MLTLILLSSAFALWLVLRYRRMNLLRRHGIPGPEPNLILGNILEINSKGYPTCFGDWTKKYGPIVGFYLGGTPHILVSDVNLVKSIMVKDFNLFVDRNKVIKGAVYATDIGERSIFFGPEAKWRQVRVAVSSVFTPSKLKKMVPSFQEQVEKVLDVFAKKSADGQKEVNVYPYFAGFAMDVLCSNVFGVKTNTIGDPENVLLKAAHDSMEVPNATKSLLFALNVLFPEMTFIWYPWRYLLNTFMDWLQVTPESKIYLFARNVMKARESITSKPPNDLLQLMIDAKVPSEVDGTVQSLGSEDIVSSSFVFFLAGYETASFTLSCVAHYMVNYPDIQQKMREEVQELVAKEAKLDYNVVTGLPLMEAFISETIRLIPPAPAAHTRTSSTDYVYGNIVIPKGTGVFLDNNALHRDPEFWENPDVFDPNRFLGANKSNVNPYAYIPFGEGPRICPGMRFAHLEMKLFLANLLLRFELKPSVSTERGQLSIYAKYFTVGVKKGVHLNINPCKGVSL